MPEERHPFDERVDRSVHLVDPGQHQIIVVAGRVQRCAAVGAWAAAVSGRSAKQPVDRGAERIAGPALAVRLGGTEPSAPEQTVDHRSTHSRVCGPPAAGLLGWRRMQPVLARPGAHLQPPASRLRSALTTVLPLRVKLPSGSFTSYQTTPASFGIDVVCNVPRLRIQPALSPPLAVEPVSAIQNVLAASVSICW